jgi:beta-galactosidase
MESAYKNDNGGAMKRNFVNRTFALAVIVVLCTFFSAHAGPFVHEQSAATPVITFNNHGFLVNGKPIFVFGGQIENCRIPRDQWRDRLLRVKQAGYNTIVTYIFWSGYEPKSGEFHFEDNLNIDAWLSLIDSLGMYTFLRVGPYVCAEWDVGGFPTYFTGQNLSMRTSDATAIGHLDVWWDKLFPIVVKHQITKGGSIIFIQLENEYESVTPQDAAYLSHLETKAKALGMDVPYLFSGQNHGFAPGPPFFPTTIWMTTEFWTPKDDWIHFYGPPDDVTTQRMARYTWKMCASGVAGFSHFMVYGGTNFGYSSCGCVPGENNLPTMTTYDMQGPIGETGVLRTEYFLIKRAGLLSQSFNQLLGGSTNGAGLVDGQPGGIGAYINTSSLGKLAFLENNGTAAASVTLKFKNKSAAIPTQGPLSLPAGQFCHFLADYVLSSGDTVDYLAAGILSMKSIGPTVYLVCYGSAGTKGEISLHCATAPAPAPQSPWQWNASSKQAKLFFSYPANDSIIENSMAMSNGKTLTMLIMNDGQADKTWVLDSSIVSGAQFVYDNTVEFPVSGGKAVVYSRTGKNVVLQQAVTAPAAIPLSTMTWSSAAAEADTAFNDASWTASAQPQSMDAYGFGNGYGWYRTTYSATQASSQTITLPTVRDAAILFWNGKPSGTTVQVKAGNNVLAVLACQFGRSKLFAFAGPVGGQAKGIIGQVLLGSTTLTNWKFKGGLNGLDETGIMGTPTNWTSFLGRTWTLGGSVPADNVPRFFRYDFNYPVNAALHQTFRITVGGLSRGVAWINGHSLGRTQENMPTYAPLYVPECWIRQTNTLVIFSQDGKAPQNPVVTPQETYAVKAMTPTGIGLPLPGRTINASSLLSAKNAPRFIIDLKGRVVARVGENMPLETILKAKCSPGIYIIRLSGGEKYYLVNQRGR